MARAAGVDSIATAPRFLRHKGVTRQAQPSLRISSVAKGDSRKYARFDTCRDRGKSEKTTARVAF